MQGRLTEWNDERGFGFITPLTGDGRAFVHISEFPQSLRRPVLFDLVTFETRTDERGRPQACSIEYLSNASPRTRSGYDTGASTTRSAEIPVWIPLLTLTTLLGFGLFVRAPLILLIIAGYLLLSVVTYVAYAADKAAAQAGRFRTQESALHLLELGGGWPGALLAQRRFRHKTIKQSYQAMFWGCVIINMGALMYVLFAPFAL